MIWLLIALISHEAPAQSLKSVKYMKLYRKLKNLQSTQTFQESE